MVEEQMKVVVKESKCVLFGKLEVGDFFFKEDLECEKLSNNLAEDNIGNPIYMTSSDMVLKLIC